MGENVDKTYFYSVSLIDLGQVLAMRLCPSAQGLAVQSPQSKPAANCFDKCTCVGAQPWPLVTSTYGDWLLPLCHLRAQERSRGQMANEGGHSPALGFTEVC